MTSAELNKIYNEPNWFYRPTSGYALITCNSFAYLEMIVNKIESIKDIYSNTKFLFATRVDKKKQIK